MAGLDMLRKATADGNVDVLRQGVRALAEAIMEAQVSALVASRGRACLRVEPRRPIDPGALLARP